MLKVIQAIERRFQNLPGSIDRKTSSTDWNTYLQNFKFGLIAIQVQKGLGFQIYFFYYIKETLNTFLKGFSEKEECTSFVSRVLYSKISLISSTGVISWRISRSGVVEVVAFSSHQRYWWSKPSRVVLESQTGEFVLLNLWVGSQSHKRGCLCFAKAKERSSPWAWSYHGVVIVSFLLKVAIGF